ncbi:MAG: methyltransferase domain-containing protein, partial [Deltaproteobacteria bacterium]|nr:methyltransferase domain-containing protein [Deltaproteobacteria bacterium]
MRQEVKQTVKDYYGKILKGSADLKTDACCTSEAVPANIRRVLKNIHPEVLSHYYGCGLIAPDELKGVRILDLGSGSGRDCYALAQLTGETGEVVGVDMTDAQLAIANRHVEWHTEAFGFKASNVRFVKGYIEKLDELDLLDNSFDVIVSNCVINLSPDKKAVLNEAFRVLKPGGELYFSDVYADRRIPKALMDDPILYGECLSGALYWNDFFRLAHAAGFADPRLVKSRTLGIDNPQIAKKLAGYHFWSATYRLFKLPQLESACENYGQSVRYRGTIEGQPDEFQLDHLHVFPKEKEVAVDGNTWRMLNESRFQPHFEFVGDFTAHLGIFKSGGSHMPVDTSKSSAANGACCAPAPALIQLSGPITKVSDCGTPNPASASPPAQISASRLLEFWLHMGTHCNLSCPDCLEGSTQNDSRIEPLSLDEAKPLIDEAVQLNVEQLCFTGGEPFASDNFVPMLTWAATRANCLVLTNGTEPFHRQYPRIQAALPLPFKLHVRVSLDYPDKAAHDKNRGIGNFDLAIAALQKLHNDGIAISVARRKSPNENTAAVERAYTQVFEAAGLPPDMPIVAFVDLLPPNQTRNVPTVTEDCLRTLGPSPGFMCQTSRMAVKKRGQITL